MQDALRIARQARTLAREALTEIGAEPAGDKDEGEGLKGRLAVVEGRLGDAGDPMRQRPPSGAIGTILAMKQAIDDLTAELRLDREAREKWMRRVGVVLMALTTAAALGAARLAWVWASTLHH